jgi:molybdate transport system substrate-binding protein
MRFKRFLAVAVIFVMAAALPAFAGELRITTGAGYMKMAKELSAAFRSDGGTVEEMYGGNIGQVLAQVKAGSGVQVVISDLGTLQKSKVGVEFTEYNPIGDTVLVLAWRKGIELRSASDLEKPFVKSVCYPDPKAAIYGRAADAFLRSTGMNERIKDKLSQIATVPQVFSYLVSGEMDAGFVNRVVVRAGKEKIGGFLELTEGYPPLNMVAAVVKGEAENPNVRAFIKFLGTDKAKAIMKKHGVW